MAGGLNSVPIKIESVTQLNEFMQTGIANVSTKLSFEGSDVYNGSIFSVVVKGNIGNGKNILQLFFGEPGFYMRSYIYNKWNKWVRQ